MSELKRDNQGPKTDGVSEEFFLEDITDKQRNTKYNKNILKGALKRLLKLKKKRKQNKICASGDPTDFRVDRQVKLRCRQLPNVVEELRKAIIRQDWNEATTLTLVLCHPGLKYYSSIILRSCFVLLLSHPDSSSTLVQKFIRLATEYILEEDVNKYIRILFALRKSSLKPLECGKYIRRSGDYKVSRDPEFEKL